MAFFTSAADDNNDDRGASEVLKYFVRWTDASMVTSLSSQILGLANGNTLCTHTDALSSY